MAEDQTDLPVQMAVQGAVWTFSEWNKPLTIDAPALEPATAPVTSP